VDPGGQLVAVPSPEPADQKSDSAAKGHEQRRRQQWRTESSSRQQERPTSPALCALETRTRAGTGQRRVR
jgi:hypothetical protein